MGPTGVGATIAEKLARATRLLEPVTDTPRLDAEILLAAALNIRRAQLLARLHDPAEAPVFDEYVERRLNYEPLAYILGEWEFFSLPFTVEPPLLVPRPETEHLVEAVLEHIAERSANHGTGGSLPVIARSRRLFVGDEAIPSASSPAPLPNGPLRILELGTGTGCVAVSIAVNAPAAEIIATDVNPLALEVAKKNAQRHNVAHRIQFRRGDLFDALKPNDRPFDVIGSNPPYIEETAWPDLSPVIRIHEDPRALLAGPDGLDVIRRIIAEAPEHLNGGGLLAFEIGAGQHTNVESLLRQGPYENIQFKNDLANIPRIACANCQK